MPKAKKEKFYAVHIGRNGPQVYNSWEEVYMNLACRSARTFNLFRSARKRYRDTLAQCIKVSTVAQKQRNGSQVSHSPTSTFVARSCANFSRSTSPARPISGPLIPEPLPPNIKPLLPAPKVPEGEPTVDGPISLSKEQAAVYEAVKGGESVFFTGSAGESCSAAGIVVLTEDVPQERESLFSYEKSLNIVEGATLGRSLSQRLQESLL